MVRKVGRPSEQTDARQKLIHEARELFTVLRYEKVSTRMIADKAGVNVAMIRYYFGNKEGLFETMIRETLAPMKAQIGRFIDSGNQENLIGIMKTYYKTMINIPQFPRLIAQLMNMPPSDTQRKLLENVFSEVTKPAQDFIFTHLQEKQIVRPDVDPNLCRVTFISLMIFPFLAPKAMLDIHGIALNETFLNQLLEHNIKVLTQGFILAEPTRSTGEPNEN
jgi:AcrR family transcriptional regulator